jgi:Arc/MetJ-type ribon-helix-helix transcriptional regulator
MNRRASKAWVGVCLAGVALVVTACGDKEPTAELSAEPLDATEAPTQAAAPQQAPRAFTPPPVPPGEEFDVKHVDVRVENGDYESAVDVMLRAQAARQAMSDSQRLDQHNRMRTLQKQIADAMASGDPNAQRAARLLQQYNAASTKAGGR